MCVVTSGLVLGVFCGEYTWRWAVEPDGSIPSKRKAILGIIYSDIIRRIHCLMLRLGTAASILDED